MSTTDRLAQKTSYVLLVEDNPSDAALTKRAFAKQGVANEIRGRMAREEPVRGVRIDVGKLLRGEFPIVDIRAIAVTVKGDVFGGDRPLRDQILAYHAYYGSLIRRPYGEPYWTRETMMVDDLSQVAVGSELALTLHDVQIEAGLVVGIGRKNLPRQRQPVIPGNLL